MSAAELAPRIEILRADFKTQTGIPFQHFHCPFLHVDENVPLIMGHIINGSLKVCNTWIPQREDLDTFYGTIAEGDYFHAVTTKDKTAFDRWLDPTLNKFFRPQLVSPQGETLSYYFAKNPCASAGHTLVEVLNTKDELLGNLVIKKPPNEVKDLHATSCQVVINHDFRPAVIASVLKAAHLTMFRLLGYSHAFSPVGRWLASLIADFYTSQKGKRKQDTAEALARHFLPHARMVSPVILNDKPVCAGTIIDNRLLACMGASEGMFAMGVLVPAGNDAFSVWLPIETGKTINTYLSFLNEPPEAIHVKLMEYVIEGEKGPHWALSDEEPIRMELPHQLPKIQA